MSYSAILKLAEHLESLGTFSGVLDLEKLSWKNDDGINLNRAKAGIFAKAIVNSIDSNKRFYRNPALPQYPKSVRGPAKFGFGTFNPFKPIRTEEIYSEEAFRLYGDEIVYIQNLLKVLRYQYDEMNKFLVKISGYTKTYIDAIYSEQQERDLRRKWDFSHDHVKPVYDMLLTGGNTVSQFINYRSRLLNQLKTTDTVYRL